MSDDATKLKQLLADSDHRQLIEELRRKHRAQLHCLAEYAAAAKRGDVAACNRALSAYVDDSTEHLKLMGVFKRQIDGLI